MIHLCPSSWLVTGAHELPVMVMMAMWAPVGIDVTQSGSYILPRPQISLPTSLWYWPLRFLSTGEVNDSESCLQASKGSWISPLTQIIYFDKGQARAPCLREQTGG